MCKVISHKCPFLDAQHRFPRFHRTVAASRLDHLATVEEEERNDIITTLPFDLLDYIIPFLDIKGYIALVATCRFLRFCALSKFQRHARTLVLQLGWPLPVPAEQKDMDASQLDTLPSASTTSYDADWLLYLSHVHRTKSMRMRRWIWAQATEIKRVYEVKKEAGVLDAFMQEERGWSKSQRDVDAQLESWWLLQAMLNSEINQGTMSQESLQEALKYVTTQLQNWPDIFGRLNTPDGS